MKKQKKANKPHLVKPVPQEPKPAETPVDKPAYEQSQEQVRQEDKGPNPMADEGETE